MTRWSIAGLGALLIASSCQSSSPSVTPQMPVRGSHLPDFGLGMDARRRIWAQTYAQRTEMGTLTSGGITGEAAKICHRQLRELQADLQQWSGKTVEVVVATDPGAHSHASATEIILEPSVVGSDPSLRAFIVAHEFGHVALGHVGSAMCPGFSESYGSNPFTVSEDAADGYAAKYLAERGLPIRPVWNEFFDNPYFVTNEGSHSTGPVRARLSLNAYLAAGGTNYDAHWLDTVTSPASR